MGPLDGVRVVELASIGPICGMMLASSGADVICALDLGQPQAVEALLRLFEASDCRLAPVLGLAKAAVHPRDVSRGTFMHVDGVELIDRLRPPQHTGHQS